MLLPVIQKYRNVRTVLRKETPQDPAVTLFNLKNNQVIIFNKDSTYFTILVLPRYYESFLSKSIALDTL